MFKYLIPMIALMCFSTEAIACPPQARAAVQSSCYRQEVRQVREVVEYEAPVVERVIEKQYYTVPNAVREVRRVEEVRNVGAYDYGSSAVRSSVRTNVRNVGSGVGSAQVRTGPFGGVRNVTATDGASVDVKFRGLLRNRVSSIRIN